MIPPPRSLGSFVLLFAWVAVFPIAVAAQEEPAVPAGGQGQAPSSQTAATPSDWLDLLELFDADDTRLEFERSGARVGLLLLGNAHVRTSQFELWADGIGVSRSQTEPGADPSYRLVAVGAVILLHQEQSFRAETLFYDHTRRRAAMTQFRLRVDVEFLSRPTGFAGELPRDARDAEAALLDGWSQAAERTSAEAGGASTSDLGTMPASGPPGRPRLPPSGRLVVAARELELEDFAQFEGRGIQVTTCDFGDPHWAVEADRLTAERFVTQDERTARETSHYEAQLSSTRLRLGPVTIPFLPSLGWDTRWNDSIPLRSASYSNSSNFGQRVDTLWRGDLLLPRSLRSWIDLGIRLDSLSKRGTGYGAEARWGLRPSRWNRAAGEGWGPWGLDFYGSGNFYGIHDRGVDANDVVPEHEQRNRVRIHQRVRLPWGTWVDAEYAVERDANFLEEYFESELRGEKVPENLIYVRHPISELATVTALAKVQKVTFRREVERVPELAFFWVEQPVAETGFDLDVTARAADLRFEPASLDALQSRELQRGDLRATLARAVGNTRWVKVRPFFEARYTAWEEDEVRLNAIERLALASGASARWHLARTFAAGWGPYTSLRHTIDPEVRYRVIFENNVDPAEVFRFDATEDVQRFESLTVSLRSFLFGRRPGPRDGPSVGEAGDVESTASRTGAGPVLRREPGDFTRQAGSPEPGGARSVRWIQPPGAGSTQQRLIEGELSIEYFPDPNRDNAGEAWGPARGQLLLELVPWIGYFAEARYDVVGDARFEQFDHGLQLRNASAAATVGTRYRRHQGNFITASGQWFASDRYEFDAFYSYDLRREVGVDQYYSVVRNFHRWAVMFTLEIDEGEDDNVSFFVRFGPRELWRAIREN
ncbi:MAG: hypothetical protein AB7O52_15915 [Planctomycetota bacterium]